MLIANIKLPPIRIEIERVGSRKYVVSRGGSVRGKVLFTEGRWQSMDAHLNQKTGGVQFSYRTARQSFRTAVLHLCRQSGVYANDSGTHPPRLMLVQRIGIGGTWFTVISDPNGIQHPSIFLDHPKALEEPSDLMASVVRRAFHEIAPVTSVKGILKSCM